MKSAFNKIKFIVLVMLLLVPVTLMGQQERKYIRKGNRLYEKTKYAGSETQYHRAEGIDKPVPDATFNVGDALYKQQKYSEAAENFNESVDNYSDPKNQAEAYYNQGNALLKDNKLKESIDAYIKSLLLSPDNMNAKYNLAYAQDQLKKQEEQEKQQQDKKDDQKKDQDKEKKDDNKDKKDQDKDKDQQKQDQQKQNQDQQKNDQGKDQQKQDQGQQNKEQNGQNNENGQQQPGMSKEDAKRLLDALSANEKDVQAKVNREKMSKANVRVEKNW